MDAAQIEQMNKLRVSLGMAPLPVPGATDGPQFRSHDDSASGSEEEDISSTLDKRHAAAGSNWQKREDERLEKLERQKRKDAAKKVRDLAQKYTKLEGKGLGDVDEGEELDTKAWARQFNKRQKKLDQERARKMAEELAAREQQAEYSSRDLAGVKVGHEMAEFDDATGEQILTLKDAEIGEQSEDDELESAELKAKEKLEERLKLKRKRPDYDPTELGDGAEKAVLSKYDDEIDGKKSKRFTIDGEGNTVDAERRALDADGEVKRKGVKISLDMLKDDAPVSDYVDPSTIKVKKPKKQKKEKKTRQKTEDDDDDIFARTESPPNVKADANAMDMDAPTQANGSSVAQKRAFDFQDDDDLQANLAEQRRRALKKRKKMDATELARQMREEMAVDEEEPEDGGLTIDETSEFVANLKKPELVAEGRERERKSRTPQPAAAQSPDADEDEDGDTAMGNESYAAIEQRTRDTSTPAADVTATGLEAEDTMAGAGLGETVHMLRQRNLMHNDAASAHLTEHERQRQRFLAEKKQLIDDFDRRAKEDRERDRARGVFDKMSNRDRELYSQRQNEARERYINQLLHEMFKEKYRPEVELRYTDDDGREMNEKEAFKFMSHRFHGKGSGKGKTEKHLKKVADEKRELGRGLLNVGGAEGGLGFVQGREGRRQKTAGVRLQ